MRARVATVVLSFVALALALAATTTATTFALHSHTHHVPSSSSSPAYTVSIGVPHGSSYRYSGGGEFLLDATTEGQKLEVYGQVANDGVERSDQSGHAAVLRLADGAHGHWISSSAYLIPGSTNVYLVALHGGGALHLCLQDDPQDSTRDSLIRAIALDTSGSLS